MKDLKDKLKFPLFAIEGLDVSLYFSVEALERQIEGIIALEGHDKFFDAEGRSLKLEAIGAKRGRFMVTAGYSRLRDAEDMPGHKEELASLLREYLNAVGHPVDESTELKELVRICARRQMEGK